MLDTNLHARCSHVGVEALAWVAYAEAGDAKTRRSFEHFRLPLADKAASDLPGKLLGLAVCVVEGVVEEGADFCAGDAAEVLH